MHININCQYNDQGAWCINKNIKRSLFGFGARCCILHDTTNKICSFRKPKPKPIAPPPCPSPKRIIREDVKISGEYIDILEKKIIFLTNKIEELTTKKELSMERPKTVCARKFVEGLPYIGEYYQPESNVYKKKDAEKYFDFLEKKIGF